MTEYPRHERSRKRRRAPLIVAAAAVLTAAVAAGVVVASRDATPTAAKGLPATAPNAATRVVLKDGGKGVPLERLVGQTLMGRVDGTVAGADVLARIRRGELGGVIVFANSFTSLAGLRALIGSLQAAAKEGGNPPLLIAVDQEGGIVKRLPDGPPTLSPPAIGARGVSTASRQGEATGRYLRGLGIDVDLAPVLDVPQFASSFIASRAFSAVPAQAARVGSAFATGLQTAGVAATAKHFPGLGTAQLNTDGAPVTIKSSRAELMRRLAPFRQAVRDGTKLVMVSNASYKTLDPSGLPAILSPAIVDGLLRKELGFKGVVITDTMTAPGPGNYPDAGIRALNAGVDVLLYSDGEALSAAAFPTLVQAVQKGDVSRKKVVAAYNRVLALKKWLAKPVAKRPASAAKVGINGARELTRLRVLTGNISPKSVVASGHGLFFAQNMMYRHSITVYDRSFRLVKTIDDAVDLERLGGRGFPGTYRGAPVEAAFTSDGAYAYVSNYSMYGPKLVREGHDTCSPSSGYDRSFVYRVNVPTLRIDRAIAVGSTPKYVAVTPDDRYALVTNWCSYSLSVVSTRLGRQVKELSLGAYPRGIAVDPESETAYVAVMGSRDIARVDLKTWNVRWIRGVGSAPRHVVISPKGNFLYATLNGEGRVAKVSLASGATVAKVSTGSQPRSMAISDDGKFLYVVNYSSSSVSKVRTRDMAVVQTVSTGSFPIGITYDAATRQVWVACYAGSIEVWKDA